MRKLVLIAVTTLTLVACDESTTPPTEGVITALQYGGESFWYTPGCGQYANVTKTRPKTTGTGKNKRTTIETYIERKCIQNIQIAHRKPPWWKICVARPEGGDYCFSTSETNWRRYRVGGYWRLTA